MKLFMCAYVALAVVVPSSTSQSFVDGIRGPRIEQKEIRHDEHEGGKGNGEGSHYDKCSTENKHEILSPLSQTLFNVKAPNALDPEFLFEANQHGIYHVRICKNEHHDAGLLDPYGDTLYTPIYGYGDGDSCTWPGKTILATSFDDTIVIWNNTIPIGDYLLTSLKGDSVVDTTMHWAYSLHGFKDFTIEHDGVPTVVHVHGHHTDFEFDGGPEQFFSPNFQITGPEWEDKVYKYDNSQEATISWYHDHTLGITRLNLYAGMAGFFVLRDDIDTGKQDNPVGLPAEPYEAAFVIQDRYFKDNGELFYPAFPGDPGYDDFIDADVTLPEDKFPCGGPTQLAEFFGNFFTVNGKIWPKFEVEPRNYRLRLLNGCDSRFIIIQFFVVDLDETELPNPDVSDLDFIRELKNGEDDDVSASKGKGKGGSNGSKGSKGDDNDPDATEEPTAAPTQESDEPNLGDDDDSGDDEPTAAPTSDCGKGSSKGSKGSKGGDDDYGSKGKGKGSSKSSKGSKGDDYDDDDDTEEPTDAPTKESDESDSGDDDDDEEFHPPTAEPTTSPTSDYGKGSSKGSKSSKGDDDDYSSKGKGKGGSKGSKGSKGDDDDVKDAEEPTAVPTKEPDEPDSSDNDDYGDDDDDEEVHPPTMEPTAAPTLDYGKGSSKGSKGSKGDDDDYSSKGKGKGGSKGSKGGDDDNDDDNTEEPTVAPTKSKGNNIRKAKPIPFYVTGDDHALAFQAEKKTTLMIEPGARYDIVIDFLHYGHQRIIMKNIAGDESFGGDVVLEGPDRQGTGFDYMDRIMAFDVVKPFDHHVPDNFDADKISFSVEFPPVDNSRRLGLFEGRDAFGRLQPLLGTIDKAIDDKGQPVMWPENEVYKMAGLAGKQMEGTMGWHEPTTEIVRIGETELWEIWNLSADAHPIHIHMVFFEVVARYEVVWDSATTEIDRSLADGVDPQGDGTYLIPQKNVQHDGEIGEGFRVGNPTTGDTVDKPFWYFEDGPKDSIMALPNEVTIVKATFDKVGIFVWHCHILSHEDHEMMRRFEIVEKSK